MAILKKKTAWIQSNQVGTEGGNLGEPNKLTTSWPVQGPFLKISSTFFQNCGRGLNLSKTQYCSNWTH